ncbi:choline dehydrogenase-like flavoprotein [Kineothrix alysoides]|uniref:Choline dehydrogenase-like flavoprotein n=1 Tax=Kineothrix alysoides TaxID=1469948 RepID=A0A4R1QM94_9FIRM|nr:GMC family oxidoreductase N-terminal domain-containing protein [Kineothrix alysoides]TCL54838.1 choline dehydrogenase-like flavoprotein [Kineothrix alysoides]
MEYDVGVIVIGAGGGGAVAAKELGEKGIKVLVLEAGPWYGNEKWPKPNAEPGAESSSSIEDLNLPLLKESFTDLENDMNDTISGKFRWGPADRNRGPWPRNVANGGSVWQSAGVGGTTLIYTANCPRAYPASVNNIWPISYNELVPYYERVEAALPVIDSRPTAKENLFYYGAKQANWNELTGQNITQPGYRPQPNAILLHGEEANIPDYDKERDGDYGCTLRGHCVNGCHIGPKVQAVAKRSTFASYIPWALYSGNVQVRPNAFVTQILTEEDSEKVQHAVGVIYKDSWTGEVFEQRADVVVMAGGAIETPRLWLNSGLPHNPWVGRGLVNHWMDSVTGIFDEEVLMEILGSPDISPFVGQNGAARFDYPGLGVIQTMGFSPGLYSSSFYGMSDKGFAEWNKVGPGELWNMEGAVAGAQLKEMMMDYKRTLSLLIFTDDEVSQRNGVSLDYKVRDAHGFIPKIVYYPGEKDRIKRDRLATIAADILKKAGARTILRSNWPANLYIHIQSTMRVGVVTDTDCEAKQVKRLFIADNSVLFNSLGGPNPTLTTQAMAVRTSEKIKDKYF